MRSFFIFIFSLCALAVMTTAASAKTLVQQPDYSAETDNYSCGYFSQTFIPSGVFNGIELKAYNSQFTYYYVFIDEIDPNTQSESNVGFVTVPVSMAILDWNTLTAKFNDITPVAGKIYRVTVRTYGNTFKLRGSTSDASYQDGSVFGDSLNGIRDLYFKVIEFPTVSQIGQFKGDGTTAISAGGDIGEESKVVFKATISSPYEEDVTAEVKINGNVVGSDSSSTNSDTSIEKENISSGYYQWYLNVIDEDGNASGLIDGSYFNASDIPFSTNTVQLSVSEGAAATGNSITMRETLYDRDGHQSKFQVELRQINEPFTGVEDSGFKTSSVVNSGQSADIEFNNLLKRKYHWRSRVIDSENHTSYWREFGTPGNVDFMVGNWTESSPVEQAEAGYQTPYSTYNVFQSLGNGLSGTATAIHLRAQAGWTRNVMLNILECNSNMVGFDTNTSAGCSLIFPNYIVISPDSNNYIDYPLNITFNPDKFYILDFYQEWKLYGSTDFGSYINGSIGSYGDPNNYDDVGNLKQAYLKIDGVSQATPIITPFWAAISNTPILELRDKPIYNTENIIKKLPKDWVVKVTSTDNNYDYQTGEDDDGYNWYYVENVTDGKTGWMAAVNRSDNTTYLSYDGSKQSEYADNVAVLNTTNERIPVIIDAVNDYYGNTNTSDSLYGTGGNGNHFFTNLVSASTSIGFPINAIPAMVRRESGSNLDNEICSALSDGGIGLLQITSSDLKGLGSGLIDQTGIASDCKLNQESSLYYSNTKQGIYASVKDAFRALQSKAASTESAQPYSDQNINLSTKEMRVLSTVYRYNQGSPFQTQAAYETYTNKDNWSSSVEDDIWDNYLSHLTSQTRFSNKSSAISWMTNVRSTCASSQSFGSCMNQLISIGLLTGDPLYLDHIANYLKTNQSPFGSSHEDETLAENMEYVNNNAAIIHLGSPGELHIRDKYGRVSGLVDGVVKQEVSNVFYDQDNGGFTIFFPQDDLQYEVEGNKTGEYGLAITMFKNGKLLSFNANAIHTNNGERHLYEVNWEGLKDGKSDAITVKMNHNNKESIIKIGSKLRVDSNNYPIKEIKK